MITTVSGKVIHIDFDYVILETYGIGYKIVSIPSTLANLNEGLESKLITVMIIRGESILLYGFSDWNTRNLFCTLIGVSGIGPRIALAILTIYEPMILYQALIKSDINILVQIPGIGKRCAERMVVELRDKATTAVSESLDNSTLDSSTYTINLIVIKALIGLGFSDKQATEVTKKVLINNPQFNTSLALSAALSMLDQVKYGSV